MGGRSVALLTGGSKHQNILRPHRIPSDRDVGFRGLLVFIKDNPILLHTIFHERSIKVPKGGLCVACPADGPTCEFGIQCLF